LNISKPGSRRWHTLGAEICKLGIPIIRPHRVDTRYMWMQKHSSHKFRKPSIRHRFWVSRSMKKQECAEWKSVAVLADRDPRHAARRTPAKDGTSEAAIPRRGLYTITHMDVVAWGLKQILGKARSYRGLARSKYEAPIMRHFTATFEQI